MRRINIEGSLDRPSNTVLVYHDVVLQVLLRVLRGEHARKQDWSRLGTGN